MERMNRESEVGYLVQTWSVPLKILLKNKLKDKSKYMEPQLINIFSET